MDVSVDVLNVISQRILPVYSLKVAVVRCVALRCSAETFTALRRLAGRPLVAGASSWDTGPSPFDRRQGFPCTRRSPRRSADRLRRILRGRAYPQLKALVWGSAGIPDSLGGKQVSTSGPAGRPGCYIHVPVVPLWRSTHLVPVIAISSFLVSKVARIRPILLELLPATLRLLACANVVAEVCWFLFWWRNLSP